MSALTREPPVDPPGAPEEKAARHELLWMEGMQANQKQRALFAELTGVIVSQMNWRARYRLVEAQALKITGLKTQMAQMTKGYRRKIARLERRIAELETAS